MNGRHSPPPRPKTSHPVRPPRVKKNSVSSATEEEIQKLNVLEKAPRRKKRVTEINPEDVVEARNRKYSSTSKDSDNVTIKSEKRREVTEVKTQLNEEMMNNRNKIYGMKSAHSEQLIELEIPRGQVEIMNDKGGDHHYSRKCNDYERLPLKSKNYDIVDGLQKRCCREKNGSVCNEDTSGTEERIYEKNQGFYDLNRSAAKNCDKIGQRGELKSECKFYKLEFVFISLWILKDRK